MKCATYICTVLFLLLISAVNINSQTDLSWFQEYKTVVPGQRYEAGWFHKFLFGSNWRDVWTTPVRIGVINLDTYAGGLVPIKKGGGNQTKNLRFRGADGKEYKFRSLDKDPSKVLPKELRESVAKDIFQDQISTANPYAGLVVNHILEVADVRHAKYTLAILPNDSKLGEFQQEFRDMIGMMEIVPEEEQFEGSDKVIGSVKLLDRLNKEFDESVDGNEFLKARLLDIFLGDASRHKDNWKWIRYKDGDKEIYKPFPTDRDQALSKFEGVLTSLAKSNFPQFNNFTEDYSGIRAITWHARYLDQRFLTFISKEQWTKVTNELHSKLTNEVIEDAVKKLPAEVYPKAKTELVEKLKSRRDGLKEMSTDYYEYVNSIVDIYTTDKDDYVNVSFNPVMGSVMPGGDKDKDVTMVTIFKKGKDEKKSGVLRQRVFDNNITKEIRLYVQNGDDEVIVSGKSDVAPQIRIIGGDGADEIKNSSDENVVYYDDGKKSRVSGDISRDDEKYVLKYEPLLKEFNAKKDNLTEEQKEIYEDSIGNLRYDPVTPPDKFNKISFSPLADYNSDAGLLIGIGTSYTKYGFRMNPYLYKINNTIGYATQKKGVAVFYFENNSMFYGLIRNASVNFNLMMSGIEVNNYFGQGNNTVYNDELYKNRYYRVDHNQYNFNPTVTFPRDKKHKFLLGGIVRNFVVKEEKSSSVMDIMPYGVSNFSLLGTQAGFELDGRDHHKAPYKGYYFNTLVSYYPKVFNNQFPFGKIMGDIRGYLGYKTNISLALRLRGEKIFGTYPFFESAFLGGSKLLRGYPRERFAGDASVIASSEVRLKLFKINILLPITVGIHSFVESGRVYLKGEDSNQWHTGYGGGLFMHFINRDFTLNFTLARSKEKDYKFYFNSSFGF